MVGKTIHELFPEEANRRLESGLWATIEGDVSSFSMDFENHVHHEETTTWNHRVGQHRVNRRHYYRDQMRPGTGRPTGSGDVLVS